jgi:fructose-1,6-bisphosphatase
MDKLNKVSMKTSLINTRQIKLIGLFFFFISLNNVKSSNLKISNENEPCIYSMNDGTKIDFRKLRKNTIDYIFVVGRYEYKANFCGPLVHGCIQSLTPAAIFLNSNRNNNYRKYMYK